MSTLLLLRHGQAAFGEDNYDQLSDLGQTQARAAGEFIRQRQWRFDRVFCGPRHRHRDTATLALGADHPMERVELLDEFAEGSQILKTAERLYSEPVFSAPDLPRKQRLEAYLETIDRWAAGEATIDGTPPAEEFLASISQWLRDVTAASPAGSHLLAVTSGGVIAAILCHLLNLPPRQIAPFMRIMENGALTSILFSGKRLSLHSFNETGHLAKDELSAI